MKNIFLRGIERPLGYSIAKKLIEAGYKLHVCKTGSERNLRALFSPEGLTIHAYDLFDFEEMSRVLSSVDAVVDAAMIREFDDFESSQLYSNNVADTKRLVDIALEGHTGLYIFISSAMVLGANSSEVRITEKSSIHSEDSYELVRSIRAAEQEVWRGHAESLKTVILNPATILNDPFDETVEQLLYKCLMNMQDRHLRGINSVVSHDQISGALIKLLQKDDPDERYILASEPSSWSSVKEWIKAYSDPDMLNRFNNGILSNFLSAIKIAPLFDDRTGFAIEYFEKDRYFDPVLTNDSLGLESITAETMISELFSSKEI